MNLQKLLRSLFSIVCIFLGISCTTYPEVIDEYFISSKEYLQFPDELKKAKEQIDAGRFLDAESDLDKFLRKPEKLYWYGHGFYLMGRTLKVQEKWQESVDYYRQAVEMGKKYDSSLMLSSLYELSWLYESLEMYPEMIASLLDMSMRQQIHSQFVTEIEIPARMAAAYVALNKDKEGIDYLNRARKAYQLLANRVHFNSEEKSRVGVALYYMGLLPLLNTSKYSYDKIKKELSLGQENLLKVVEDDKSYLSDRSREILTQAYVFLWDNVKQKNDFKTNKGDKIAFKKNISQEQLVMASDIFDLIQALKGFSNPTLKASRNIKILSNYFIALETEIFDFVNGLDLGPEITKEGRAKIMRLKTVNPNPALENKYLRINKEQTKDLKNKKDPNL